MPTPIELVRKRVLSIIEEHGLSLVKATDLAFSQSDSSEGFSYADTREIILDMIESGILLKQDELIFKNNNYVDIPEDSGYQIEKYISYPIKIDITGTDKANSVGSEDFFYNMQDLKDGDEIFVELAPEPNNEFDENAVAILYDEKVIGYFERRSAKNYQDLILSHNRNKESVIAKAKVVVAKELNDLKYVIVLLK